MGAASRENFLAPLDESLESQGRDIKEALRDDHQFLE